MAWVKFLLEIDRIVLKTVIDLLLLLLLIEEVVRGYGESWMEIAKAAGEGKAPSDRTKKFMNAKNFIDDIRPVVRNPVKTFYQRSFMQK